MLSLPGTAGALTGSAVTAAHEAVAQTTLTNPIVKAWPIPDEGEPRRHLYGFWRQQGQLGQRNAALGAPQPCLVSANHRRFEPVLMLVNRSEMALVRKLMGSTSQLGAATPP